MRYLAIGTTTLLLVALLGTVVGAVLCRPERASRFGNVTLWSLCLATCVSDEDEAELLGWIGKSGNAAGALDFLRATLSQRGSTPNDVALQGLVEGLAATGSLEARHLLVDLFRGNRADARSSYKAILAAWGLQRMRGSQFEPSVPSAIPDMYRKFGVSNFATTEEERLEGARRFGELNRAVEAWVATLPGL